MCYYKWKKSLIEVVVKFKAEKILCTFLSCTKHLFEGHKISCTKSISYAYLKMERLISVTRFGSWFLKKVSWCAHFLTMVLACIQKNYVPKFPIFLPLKLRSCKVVVFIDMNLYICSEGRNFKTFFEENYAITVVESCYLFTKKMLKMELNLILILLMRFGNIRYSWNLQQIWWIHCNLSRLRISFGLLVCNTIRFFFICLWKNQYFYKSQWLQITRKHWNKVRY